MTSTILSVESKRLGCYRVFLRIAADDTVRPFFKSTDLAQLRNYVPGKACLSRCFRGANRIYGQGYLCRSMPMRERKD